MADQVETKPTIGQDLAQIVQDAQELEWLGVSASSSFQTVADTIADATRGLGVEKASEKPVETKK